MAYNIGGSDEAVEGTFKWVTGETFSSFMNWNTGQPDNWNGLEDYLMVYSSASILGKWNDDANYNPLNINTFGFICEVEPVGLPVATMIG